MGVRRATMDDFEAIAELERYAYDLPPDYMEMAKDRFRLSYDEHFLVEENGRLVATTRLVELEQNVRQTWKKMGGVSMVATSPEARRRGHYRRLMIHMTEYMHDNDFATSVLYPFKDTFYGAFGYVNCAPMLRVVANPAHLKRWKLPSGYSVERMPYGDAQEHYKSVQIAVGERTHGATRRSSKRWEELSIGTKSNVAVAFGPDGSPEGVLISQHKGYANLYGNDDMGQMRVREWLWTNTDARSALLNYVHLHSDQILRVELPVNPLSDDYYQWIEGRNIMEMNTGLPFMARCVSVQKALEGLPASLEGKAIFRVEDPLCAWNNQTFQVKAESGQLTVEPLEDSKADTTISIEGVSALVYGTMTASELVPYGWISGAIPNLIMDWFPRAYAWMYEQY
ncbi:MAG: enhanced intracellular survival protein Eis [Candidatus Hermodarchaeota archaeon]